MPPKATGLSFTIEDGLGRVLHFGDGVPIRPPAVGCRLWMLNDDDYKRAFTDAGKRRPNSTSVVLRHVRPDTVVPNDPRWHG